MNGVLDLVSILGRAAGTRSGRPYRAAIRVIRLLVGVIAAVYLGARLSGTFRPLVPAMATMLAGRLVLGVVIAASAVGILSVIDTLRVGFADQTAALLMTLALKDETRFRLLVSTVSIRRGEMLLLLTTAGVVAASVGNGGAGLAWALLLLIACAFAIVGAVLVVCLWVRFGAARSLVGAAVMAGIGAWSAQILTYGEFKGPVLFALVGVVLLALVLGPCAGMAGRLYARAYVDQGTSRKRIRSGRLARVLAASIWRGRGNVLTAVAWKECINRSRSALSFVRLAAWLSPLFALSLLRQVSERVGAPLPFVLVCAILAASFVSVNELLTGAINTEGARIALFLSAGSARAIARAKLCVWVGAVVAGNSLITMVSGLMMGLAPADTLGSVVIVSLISAGSAFFLLTGSGWDLDPELPPASGLQQLLLEETPLGPYRMLSFFVVTPVFQLGALACVYLIGWLKSAGGLIAIDLCVGLMATRVIAAHLELKNTK